MSGIGPAKAKELVDAGIKSIEDLKKHEDKLNHHQKIGLKYVTIIFFSNFRKELICNCCLLFLTCYFRHLEDFEKKIPRTEIEVIEKRIKEYAEGIDEDYIITICGSYRRGKEESGDIDVLLTHPIYTSDIKDSKKHTALLKLLVKKLEAKKFITDTISHGDLKFMVKS